MDKWEYMVLRYQQPKPNGARELYRIAGPSFIPNPVVLDQADTGDPAMRHLDQLGAEGWELVSTERQDTEWLTVRLHWLKKRFFQLPPTSTPPRRLA